MGLADIPALVKHVTIAIYRGDSIPGSGEAKFLHAFKIARGTLVRTGYLTERSDTGDTASIRLTPKGWQRNFRHVGDNPDKTREFNELFRRVEMAADGSDDDTKSNETPSDTGVEREKTHAEKLRSEDKPRQAKKKKPFVSG